MNFVYVSPNFPSYYWHFCDHLKKLGVNVLGIGNTDYDQLEEPMKGALTEYYKVSDLSDYDQILRACGYFTHKYGHIDHLDSQNEFWLENDARLRTDFNIEGTKLATIMDMKRKSLMKDHFKKAGVPSARYQLVTNIDAAKNFIASVGYPVIVKPDIGVGASATFALHNENDLDNFFANLPVCDYIMEEFVKGHILTFDGLTNYDNKILFATSHLFPNPVMDVVTGDDHLAFYSLREIDSDLEMAGRKIVAAFDTSARIFHFEFFRLAEDKNGLGKKGDIVALEVNMRPPGSYMLDMINYASDIDIYQMWATMIVHKGLKSEIDRKYHCAYASRKNHKKYLHSHTDILATYGENIVFHTEIEQLFSRAMGNYTYIFRSPSLDIIKKMIAYIQAEKPQ